MRTAILATLLVATSFGWAADAPSPTIAAFTTAMGGQDMQAKKKAMQALVGEDDVILPILVSALGDRQVGEFALESLRARTGLTPPTNKRVGGPGYPGYPKDDSASSWSGWLAERTKAVEQEKLLEELKNKDDKKPEAKTGQTTSTEETATTSTPKTTVPDADLGTIDRVILKTGGALRCYILSKRTDADGNIISIRIAHPDGGGEEVLQADLIARLEEDVK